MRYLLQVYFKGAQQRLEQLSDADRAAVFEEYAAVFASPEIRDGNQLQPPVAAVTVRLSDGELVLAEGPFAEAGEALGGYYLIEVADRDAAVALASRIPALRMGGAIEVRPVFERDVAIEAEQ
jgi:hypothetical protein